MNIKRTIGTGKIFLYSCGAVIALAAVVWLIINGIFAVYLSGKEPSSWRIYYNHVSSDVLTPWLLMAAAGVIFYRYCKMCSANSISGTKQTIVLTLLPGFIPMTFAAADLLFTKLVLQRLYGGVVYTSFENDNYYFSEMVSEYADSLGETVPEIYSPYTMKTLLLIFAVTAVYYYCFFITGCYIAQCLKCGRRKLLMYYAVTIFIEIALLNYSSEAEWLFEKTAPSVLIIISLLMVVLIFVILLSNPIVFLFAFCFLSKDSVGTIIAIILWFIIAAFYNLTMVSYIEMLHKEQFPKKKQIKKALENYYSKNNYRGEGIK